MISNQPTTKARSSEGKATAPAQDRTGWTTSETPGRLACERILSRPGEPLFLADWLNVRTYVLHEGEPGIHFLAEWLPNRMSVFLGPVVFGLPYRLGRLRYQHDDVAGGLRGEVSDATDGTRLAYHGRRAAGSVHQPCKAGSEDEWLMERYTAFTWRGGRSGFFRVWHPPWRQARAEVDLDEDSLLRARWPCLADGEITGANYSPGFRDVWMGRPHRARPV